MDDLLQKVDILRQRLHIGYKEAYELLSTNRGNVVQALIAAEEKRQFGCNPVTERMTVMTHELVDKIQDLIRSGNVSKIKLIRNGKTLFTLPAVLGLAMAMIFPYTTLLLAMGAKAIQWELVVERNVGQVNRRAVPV